MKNLVVIFVVLFFSSCAMNKNRVEVFKKEAINEEQFSHIRYILYLLEINDLKTLNETYINKDFGYFEVNLDELNNKISIVKKDLLVEVDNFIESFNIENRAVTFNCSPYNDAFYGWNENGIFIFEPQEEYFENYLKNTSKEEQNFINIIKKSSYEVVVTYNTIFYLTMIDKKYYITLIDNFKTNCANAVN